MRVIGPSYKHMSEPFLRVRCSAGAHPFRKSVRIWKRHDNLIVRRRRVQFNTKIEMRVEVVESSSDPVILEIKVGSRKILLDICWSLHVHQNVFTSGGKAEIPSD